MIDDVQKRKKSEYVRKWQKKQKLNGKCEKCVEIATHGLLCLKHRLQYRELDKKRKRKRVEQGVCLTCSAPLHPEMDGGRVTCLNCREETPAPHFI
jgi:hypothetical protein